MLSSKKLAVGALVLGYSSSVFSQDVSDSQYWHERYHGILSMAAYGDYATLCPQQTFTQQSLYKAFPNSQEAPWTLLQSWGPTASGLEGFIATIPEMDKVVMVFKGNYGWQDQWDQTSVNIDSTFSLSCPNCQAHAGAVQAYLEAKEATNDWASIKSAVAASGHQWSITGHGFGGMVAQVAALDLGWRGLSHWVHSHGSPRVMNADSAALFNKLYEGEASQRTVANQDSWPTLIPASDDYQHVLQGFNIWGTNSTYGMNYAICNDINDPMCLGGDQEDDTWYYYTRAGQCGGDLPYDSSALGGIEYSISSVYFATATVTPGQNAVNSSTSTSSPSASVSTTEVDVTTFITSTSTMAPLPVITVTTDAVAGAANAAQLSQAAAPTAGATSGSSILAVGHSSMLVALAALFALYV